MQIKGFRMAVMSRSAMGQRKPVAKWLTILLPIGCWLERGWLELLIALVTFSNVAIIRLKLTEFEQTNNKSVYFQIWMKYVPQSIGCTCKSYYNFNCQIIYANWIANLPFSKHNCFSSPVQRAKRSNLCSNHHTSQNRFWCLWARL